MRIPTPPLIVLSQNGHRAASLYGAELTLVDLLNRRAATQPLPHEGLSLVFSPSGSRLAVAGEQELSLFQVQPDFAHLATVPIPAPLFRMALAENGLLAAAARLEENKTSLCLWQGDRLEPAFSGEGYGLGSVAAFQLALDPAKRLVFLSGASGRGAYSGGAKPFAGLMALGDNRIEVTWKGEGLPFEPDDYLFPLSGAQLGIYKRDELQVMAIETGLTPPLKPAGRWAFDNLESVVASPDGRYLGWRWGDGPDATCSLRVASLAGGQVLEAAELEKVGYFPSMAVDDAGQLTLAFSEQPNRLLFYRLAGNRLTKQFEVETKNYSKTVSWSDQA